MSRQARMIAAGCIAAVAIVLAMGATAQADPNDSNGKIQSTDVADDPDTREMGGGVDDRDA